MSRDSKSGVSDVPSTGGLPPSGCPEPKSKRATKAITKTVEIQVSTVRLSMISGSSHPTLTGEILVNTID